jgi:CheY-like chemotaxis protein
VGLFLDRLGANVLLARNASEGLDAIKNSLPDLVLSDINMPGMNGFELLREIRALGSDAGGSVLIARESLPQPKSGFSFNHQYLTRQT